MKKPKPKWMFPAREPHFSVKRLRKIIRRLRTWYEKRKEAVPSADDLQKQAEKLL